jgi:hypothetical protein
VTLLPTGCFAIGRDVARFGPALRSTSRGARETGGYTNVPTPSPLACPLLVNRVSNEEQLPLQGVNMLWTICVILLAMWFLGLVSSYTMGGLIHILLVLAVIVVVIQLVQGRRV